MKKYLFLATILVATFAIQSANAKSIFNSIKGDKNIVTKEIKIANYNSIILQGSADVIYELKKSEAPFLSLEIDNNLVEHIDIEVVNNDLIVKQKKGSSINPSKYIVRTNSKEFAKACVHGSGVISTRGKIEANSVNLCVKGSGDIDIESLTAKSISATAIGSGDIKTSGNIQADNIELSVVGSGDIEMDKLAASSVSALIKGSGDIKIKGNATSAEYTVAGSGDIKAKQLEANTVTCTVAGSGDIEANASQVLNNTIKGSGGIKYIGTNPQVNNQIKGSGSVKKIK